jgi:hypothetical protein
MNPVSTMISCGVAQFQNENHPSPVTTKRLQDYGSINKYYLTNCSYDTAFVPASSGTEQLLVPNNKSRLSGQNHLENLNPVRQRGNIQLFLTQDQSAGFGQQFMVTYFDDDKIYGEIMRSITDVLPF